jgi:broad specificity phosphatase PhoE
VRHAQSEGNAIRMLQGQFNSPLSKIGREQAAKLSHKLDFPYDAVYSSNLDRAFETAKIAIKNRYEGSIMVKSGLQEMNFGIMEKVSFDEFTSEMYEMWDKIIYQPDYNEHRGESRNDFVSRISNTIREIIDECNSTGSDKIVVFTHGGVMRVIFQYILKTERPTVSNTQIMRFKYSNGQLEFIKELK